MTKILVLHDYAGRRGGAEIIVQDLRRLLRARGHEVRLLTSDADPYAADEAPDYLCDGSNGGGRALVETFNPSAYAQLRAALSAFQPDLVHIFMFLTQLSPIVLPLLQNVPTIMDVNTYRPICPNGTRWIPGKGLCDLKAGSNCRRAGCFSAMGIAPRQIQLHLLKRYRSAIDVTVAPSHAMADILEANDWRVDRVLPYSVPYAEPTAQKSAAPLFGYAGRLVPEKGVDWLLKAFGQAFGANSSARLLIVGNGPQRQLLESLAARLNITHLTKFHGHVSRAETQTLLEPVWAQIIPSLWPEPFGLVTAEAMMRGSVAIVSDQGALKELVEHGRTGFVVPVSDVNALSEALLNLASDRTRAQVMGDAARGVALHVYSEDKWIGAYSGLYDELLLKYDRWAD